MTPTIESKLSAAREHVFALAEELASGLSNDRDYNRAVDEVIHASNALAAASFALNSADRANGRRRTPKFAPLLTR